MFSILLLEIVRIEWAEKKRYGTFDFFFCFVYLMLIVYAKTNNTMTSEENWY